MKEIVHASVTAAIALIVVAQLVLWAGSWTAAGDRLANRRAVTNGTVVVLALAAVVWAMTDSRPQPVWLFVVLAVFAVAEAARLEFRRARRKRETACWRGSSC